MSDGRLQLRFLGTGAAFDAAGRGQSSLALSTEGRTILLDAGANTPAALERRGIARSDIDHVVVSHLHGDHWAGIPFLLLAEHYSGRTAPLGISGPPGLEALVRTAFEALYPRLAERMGPPRYPLSFSEHVAGRTRSLGPFDVNALPVIHDPYSRPFGLRIAAAGKRIAYSGDARWSDELRDLARGADLLVVESTTFSAVEGVHLSHEELVAHRGELEAERLLLTHLSGEMRRRAAECAFPLADDELTAWV